MGSVHIFVLLQFVSRKQRLSRDLRSVSAPFIPVSQKACTGKTIYPSPRFTELLMAWRAWWWVTALCCPAHKANRFHASHATASLPACMLRMLSEVYFDLKLNLYRLEADRGSTRSRFWFDPKYESHNLTPLRHHGATGTAKLWNGCMIADKCFIAWYHPSILSLFFSTSRRLFYFILNWSKHPLFVPKTSLNVK